MANIHFYQRFTVFCCTRRFCVQAFVVKQPHPAKQSARSETTPAHAKLASRATPPVLLVADKHTALAALLVPQLRSTLVARLVLHYPAIRAIAPQLIRCLLRAQ